MAGGTYIFLTDEGYTFQPGSAQFEPDVENLQVLGFASGDSAEKAFVTLLAQNPWLTQTSFRETYCYRLADDHSRTRQEFTLRP